MKPSERLTAFVARRRPSGRVLDRDTTRAEVERVLGGTGDDPDGVGRLGRQPASFREYPSARIAPYGLTAWFDGDALLALVVPIPDLPRRWLRALGDPDETDDSPLGQPLSRDVWRDHGVVVHRHDYTGEVHRLDVLAAAPLEWFEDERPPRREPHPPPDDPVPRAPS